MRLEDATCRPRIQFGSLLHELHCSRFYSIAIISLWHGLYVWYLRRIEYIGYGMSNGHTLRVDCFG